MNRITPAGPVFNDMDETSCPPGDISYRHPPKRCRKTTKKEKHPVSCPQTVFCKETGRSLSAPQQGPERQTIFLPAASLHRQIPDRHQNILFRRFSQPQETGRQTGRSTTSPAMETEHFFPFRFSFLPFSSLLRISLVTSAKRNRFLVIQIQKPRLLSGSGAKGMFPYFRLFFRQAENGFSIQKLYRIPPLT